MTRNPARRSAAALLAALVASFAPRAGAQSPAEFDPDEELARFSEVSAWNQAWMLQPFLARSGRKLPPAERASVLAEWRDPLPKLEARHAAAEKDSFLARIDHIRTSVARQPFYEKLRYRVVEETRPVALFVEVPGRNDKEDALRAERIRDSYAPFLRAFFAKLDEELAPLAGAPPRTAYVVWVLQDAESYARFFREFGGQPSPLGVRAHYSPQQRWAFTWSPSSIAGPEFLEGVQSLLHELTHAYVDALLPGGIGALRLHWISEGLAEYYSCFKRGDRNVFFDPLWSQRVIETLEEIHGPHGELRIGFADWIALADGEELWRKAVNVARRRAGEANVELAAFLMSRFYAEAYLFVLWLNESRNGKYRERFREHVKLELRGKGGFEAFKAGLGEVLALPVESELDLYARDLFERRVPEFGEFTREREAAAAAAAEAAGAQSPRFAEVRRLDALLPLDTLPPKTRRALRWRRFAEAGLRDAAGAFGAPQAGGTDVDPALGAIVEREVEGLLRRLKQGGEPVLLQDGLRGRLVDFDERRVVIEQGGQKSELPRARIAPVRLAFALRASGEKSDSARAAAATFEWLGGDLTRSRETARRVSGEGARLVESLLASGEELARETAAVAAVERVLQAEPALLEKTLEEAWPAAKEGSFAPALVEPPGAVAAERPASHVQLDAALSAALHGSVKIVDPMHAKNASGPVVIELRWSFGRTGEADDFVAQPWPSVLADVEQRLDRKLPESRPWVVDGGRLRPAPGGFVVLPSPFAAKSEIELDVVLFEGVEQASFEESSFWFGLEVAGSKDLLLFDTLRNLVAVDRGRPEGMPLPDPKELLPGSTTRARLEIGAVEAVAERGEAKARAAFKMSGLGCLLLAGVGERCWQVARLVLRATLPAEAVARLQREHAVRRAAQLVK
jgi:hypothetical protein